ncbi:condensation domain-containing protein [Uliginosibacterium sp. H3]|uniref:Condensation domain-containing protein n=1 Tax=Uliginosibacterium silvisoli TaxID=3114758 RepID=A0ABU6K8K4_9RHOO|nr:condensation domain-containing protein [Uliginosibacterium sp. H3]
MLRLEHHDDCRLLSFQEEQAVRWLMNSHGRASNVNAAISFAGEISPLLLLQCVEAACKTYDGPRTRFRPDAQGRLVRHIMPIDACPIEFIVLQHGDAIGDPAVSAEVAAFCDKPFAFEYENWLRVLLIHTREGSSVIAMSMPHVIADATSIRLMISSVWRDYGLLAQGAKPVPRQPRYKLVDFVASQRAWAATPDFSARLHRLIDCTTSGIAQARRELPSGYASSALQVRPSIAVSQKLPQALCDGLHRISRQTQTSLHTVLMSGAMLALSSLFQRRHLCIRLPFSNRAHQGADDIVGFLANDVPMPFAIEEGQDCRSLIRRVQRDTFSMMRFGAVPWAVVKAHIQEASIRNPFEDYLINVFPALDDIAAEGPYRARPFPMRFAGFTSNDLKVWMQTVNGQVGLSLRVGAEDRQRAEELYMPEVIRVISAMVEWPDECVGRILDASGVSASEAH